MESPDKPSAVTTMRQHSLYRPFGVVNSDTASDTVGWYLKQISQYPLLKADEEISLAKDIEAGLFATYLLEQGEPSEATRAELAQLAFFGAQAKEIFICSNLRLVVGIAKKRVPAWQSTDFMEVITAGNEGLQHGVEKFDYTKGYKFSTYATWWIKQAMDRERAQTSRIIRVPVHVDEVLRRIGKFEAEWVQRHGHEPTEADIAAHISSGREHAVDLHRLLDYGRVVASLDMPLSNDGFTTLGEVMANIGDSNSVEDTVLGTTAEDSRRDLIRRLLEGTLDARSQAMVRMYIMSEGLITYEQVGKEFGVTRARVQQIIRKALSTLCESLETSEAQFPLKT